MILFSGQDILKKWVIVKGKAKFKLLRVNPFSHHDWEDFYSKDVLLFASREQAQTYIQNNLPSLKKFQDAHIKLLTINIS